MSYESTHKFNEARKVHQQFIKSLSTQELLDYVKED